MEGGGGEGGGGGGEGSGLQGFSQEEHIVHWICACDVAFRECLRSASSPIATLTRSKNVKNNNLILQKLELPRTATMRKLRKQGGRKWSVWEEKIGQ